jgi:hypothetical protein
MMITDVSIKNNGDVIDKTIENIYRTIITRVPFDFTLANGLFVKYTNGHCLYLNNKFYMSLEKNIWTPDGIPIPGFDDKDDVLNYLTNIGDLVVESHLGKLTITKKDFSLTHKFLTEEPDHSPLLTHMLDHIESYIMTIDHLESDIVTDDPLGISTYINLADNFAIEYPTFKEFIYSEYPNMSVTIISAINKAYTSLQNVIYQSLNLSNLNSITLKHEGNHIQIVEFDTPSSRRFKLNVRLKETDGRDDDT